MRDLADAYHIHVADCSVCPGHSAPIEFVEQWIYQRPAMSLVLGPRGGGKSFLRAFATHVDSLQFDRHAAKILGGSEAQSQQIYNALKEFGLTPALRGLMPSLTATRAHYPTTNSEVSYIPASDKSVRGPHVPSLSLDEIDEMDPEIRDASFGMCMEMHGIRASVGMTSTWHRVGGPMEQLLDQAREGKFPAYTFCVFEVLQTCPSSRSGPRVDGPDLYAGCPECPLKPFCHADIRPHPDTGIPEPKAKRSNGHYAIDSLIQKAQAVSARVFEADYLCSGPKADGLWFKGFDVAKHVSDEAEFDPRLDVHLAVDSGVWTGAVFYQVRDTYPAPIVTVFADYLSEGLTAQDNARRLIELAGRHCNGRIDSRWTDPAGGSRNPVGETVISEYLAGGLDLDRWPRASVADGLELIDSFLRPASGPPRIKIHPRCGDTIKAFQNYRRAKRAHQWMDWPEDPQHPFEDIMDSLRGGLYAEFRGPSAAYVDTSDDYRG